MDTLQERKKRVIEVINRHEDWMDDFEEMLDLIAKKRPEKSNEETWRKYVEPIGEKTDVQDIIKNGGGDDRKFLQMVLENDFLGDIPEEEIFREIEKMS